MLAPLIFGIFLEGKGKKKIPFFSEGKGNGLILRGGGWLLNGMA